MEEVDRLLSTPIASTASNQSFLELDASCEAVMPDGSCTRLDRQTIASMKRNSIPYILQRSNNFSAMVHKNMAELQENKLKRNGLDFAGKVPFSLLLIHLGIQNTLVDCSQAGGLYGTADGIVLGSKSRFIEIKGASRKKRQGPRGPRCKDQYQFEIRFEGTSWEHLFFVCRPHQPESAQCWTSFEDLVRCGFVLGYVSRDAFKKAQVASGKSPCSVYRVALTPWGRCQRNWLGEHVEWINLGDVTLQWWQDNVSNERHE